MDESTPDQPSAADDPDDDPAASAETVETDWQRKRRLAAVFGDVLPDITADEQDPESPGRSDDAQDRWLRSQVPPHHG
jgi:hypothetical protein